MNHDSGGSEMAPDGGMTARRRQDRVQNELVGLCRGLLADGHVNVMEAEFLKDWIGRNSAFVGMYPFDVLYAMLTRVLADGVIDQDESADLHDTLVRFVGGEAFEIKAQTASVASTLPLCDPAPIIERAGVFVVTGTFDYGPRKQVASVIAQHGGRVAENISAKVNYLVVGELGSRDWINSNAGRKIEAAVSLRKDGVPIGIVSEIHWRSFL